MDDPREAARADPPPESTRAVYLQIESWLPVTDEEQDNILVLTTRKESATSLRSFCHQSRRNTNVETAVKLLPSTVLSCMATPASLVATPTIQTSTTSVIPGLMLPSAELRTLLS